LGGEGDKVVDNFGRVAFFAVYFIHLTGGSWETREVHDRVVVSETTRFYNGWQTRDKMKNLTEVESFGGIDADADNLLDNCFSDHEAYVEAKDHKRFLIVGRKGSGKTAIFRKLVKTKQYNVFTFGHTFLDYPWQHHDKQSITGVPDEDRYTHSWKYLILLTASKILLNQDHSQPWDVDVLPEMAKLESFVVDSYGSRDPDVTQIFAPGKTLRINPTLGIPGTNLQAGVTFERVPVNELPTIVQEVNRTISSAVIRSLNPEIDYYVCFDQLDLGFSTSDPKYANRLVGLILAARDLSQMAKEHGKRFSVNVFLRDDIYQLLQFEDKNKLSENALSRIEWDGPRTRWTLKRLMEKRFANVLEIPEGSSWELVFDETKEMPGRQKKYHHILDRTFRRPRDIIKFCNEILSSKKARGDHTTQFQNEDIYRARQAYSEYLLNELDDEIFKHVPRYKDYIELLKSMDSLQITLGDFSQACDQRRDLLGAEEEPISVLKQLFDFSLVGYYQAGGAGGGSGYVWRYLDPRSRFDASATTFRIHSGFKEVLGLKRFRRS
jgi:hypothetical protein